MRILLFGCNGQVGWELQRSLGVLGNLVALDFDSTSHAADFTKPDQLARTIRQLRPDAIVNAAAYTAVDKAECEPELADVVNAVAPGALGHAAAEIGAWLVHYSTDYVFDGQGSRPWREHDPTGPLNIYGRSKLNGEERIRATGCRHVILRTSWVFSSRGANFARSMLKLAAEREQLSIVADQVGAPTGADTLADITSHVLRAVSSNPTLGGTYHAAASGETSWHGYAALVIEWARSHGMEVRVRADGIAPILSKDYPSVAQRPFNSRLDTSSLCAAFRLTLPHWKTGVLRMLQEVHP